MASNARTLMARKQTKAQKKTASVMREYKSGKLHSGKGGPVVKSRQQAIAIALAEGERASKRRRRPTSK